MGVGAHVEVLGSPPQQEIPDASADEIALVARRGEAIQDLERVGVDRFAGNRVRASRADARRSAIGKGRGGSGSSAVWIGFADERSLP
jgi:hypothetical protein